LQGSIYFNETSPQGEGMEISANVIWGGGVGNVKRGREKGRKFKRKRKKGEEKEKRGRKRRKGKKKKKVERKRENGK
jgi:hypothetical protein